MMPTAEKKEPKDFSKKVTEKADAFLNKTANPTRKDIDNRPYWRNALGDLYKDYEEVCAYCGLWFHRDAVTVDHFIPVCDIWNRNPKLAYEWSNFRLASRSMNGEKGRSRDVLDPFHIGPGWFVIDFPSMIIKSGPGLSTSDKAGVEATILRLKLNIKEKYINYRRKIIRQYFDMVMKWEEFGQALDSLERMAPFIAYELKRQSLTEKIVKMMKYPRGNLKRI